MQRAENVNSKRAVGKNGKSMWNILHESADVDSESDCEELQKINMGIGGFREGNSRMVQRQQQIMGEPSEREALLTILLSYACKGVLRSYLALGCERTYIAS
jgi:hypothetical protein